MGVKKVSISNKTRKELRRYALKKGGTLQDSQEWFKARFNHEISKSTISESLSEKWAWLDDDTIPLKHGERSRNYPPQWPVLDKILFEWQLERESRKQQTSMAAFLEAAKLIWHELPMHFKVDADTGDQVVCPKFSAGWFSRFKKRHNFGLRKEKSYNDQISPDPIKEFNTIRRVVKAYKLDEIYSMREHGLFWERDFSLDHLTFTIPAIEVSKRRICVALCTNADGSDKIPPFFIGEQVSPQAFGQREHETKEWIYKSRPNPWMTIELMEEWLRMFYARIEGRSVLLLIDKFYSHRCALLTTYPPPHIRIEFLPESPDRIFQPLDQGIISMAKQNYVEFLLKHKLQAYKATEQLKSIGIIPGDPLDSVSLRDAVWWFHRSWLIEIKPEVILDCFNRSTLFNENLSPEPFVIPPVPFELTKFYKEVVEMSNTDKFMDIRDFFWPEGEDLPPVSTNPTIPELVQCHTSQTKEKVSHEKDNDELNTTALLEATRSIHFLLRFMPIMPEYTHAFEIELQSAAEYLINEVRTRITLGLPGTTISAITNEKAKASQSISCQRNLDIVNQLQGYWMLTNSKACQKRCSTINQAERAVSKKADSLENANLLNMQQNSQFQEPVTMIAVDSEDEIDLT